MTKSTSTTAVAEIPPPNGGANGSGAEARQSRAGVPPNGGIEINGGILTRAPKSQNCTCKVPDMVANAIENDDEWTCACGQGWRAKIQIVTLQGVASKNPYWRRIAKRASKGSVSTPTESE